MTVTKIRMKLVRAEKRERKKLSPYGQFSVSESNTA
jgi:hypothetical protein